MINSFYVKIMSNNKIYVIALFRMVNQLFAVFSFWKSIKAQYAYRMMQEPVKNMSLFEKLTKNRGNNTFIVIVLMANIPTSNR